MSKPNLIRERRGSHRPKAGAALVEFGVVLPIIFLFFLGMIETSRVLLLQHSVDTAAYEGARNAMVPGATSEEAKNSAYALLRAAGLKSCIVNVSPETITEDTPLITVQVKVPVDKNAWAGPIWFKNKYLVSEVTLMCERPPLVKLTGIPKLKTKAKSLLDELLNRLSALGISSGSGSSGSSSSGSGSGSGISGLGSSSSSTSSSGSSGVSSPSL